MASCVVDIQNTVPAIKATNNTHRQVTVQVRGQDVLCPGGIGYDAIVQIMSKAVHELNCHFMDSLPPAMINLKPEALQQCLKELR